MSEVEAAPRLCSNLQAAEAPPRVRVRAPGSAFFFPEWTAAVPEAGAPAWEWAYWGRRFS